MSTHTIEELSPTRRKFKITVPADDVQKSWDKVVKETQASAEVRGFRKGKAPLTLIKTIYAQDITKKVANTLINESYQQAAKESNLQILNQPTVEPDSQLDEHVDFSYSATVDIYTPVEIKDYKGLSVKLSSKVSPTAEAEEVEKMLKHEAEHLSTCTEHNHAHEPVTEESTAKLKDEVKSYFKQMRARNAFEQIVTQLLEKNQFDVADTLVDSMISQMIVNQEVVKENKDPKKVNVKNPALREQYRENALKQVKGIVALTHIAEQEKIVVPFEEVAKSVSQFLAVNRMNFQQIRNNQMEIIQEHKNELTMMKVVDFILENANVTWEDEVV